EGSSVPGLRVPGVGAAAGEHGDNERVDLAGEMLLDGSYPAVAVRAERRYEHRKGVAALGLDGIAQRVHETGVAAELMGAVEDHPYGRPGSVPLHCAGRRGLLGPDVHAVQRGRDNRVEPV